MHTLHVYTSQYILLSQCASVFIASWPEFLRGNRSRLARFYRTKTVLKGQKFLNDERFFFVCTHHNEYDFIHDLNGWKNLNFSRPTKSLLVLPTISGPLSTRFLRNAVCTVLYSPRPNSRGFDRNRRNTTSRDLTEWFRLSRTHYTVFNGVV